MSTVNGFRVGSETLKYNYESLDNYNTPNFSTSSSETYAVGDYVMYNGKLYKCTIATTGGTWVSGNWTEAVLSDDVSGLTRQVNDKQNKPVSEGTAGQVLGLDSSLQPAWIDQTGGGSSVVVAGEGVGSTVQGLMGTEDPANSNTATGAYAHVEGGGSDTNASTGVTTYYKNTASGDGSHAEGAGTTASGMVSHAEGYGGTFTISGTTYESGAKGMSDHTEGYQTMTAPGQPGNHAEGYQTRATGGASHAEGAQTTASGSQSHAEGNQTTASGSQSHAEGNQTTASGPVSHAEGNGTIASNNQSHAEGQGTTSSGQQSHAEGNQTTASGQQSHAEGQATTASGYYSHAEGYGGTFTISGTTYESGAKGISDHTEGYQTMTANGPPGNHAEGYQTRATGGAAHAEGNQTTASGSNSHAEGYSTTASGNNSHAKGTYTIANHKSQHVFGEYNIADTSTAAATARGTYIEIVGNGTRDRARSNARTLDWDGNEVLAGKLTVGAAPTADMDVATKKYVDDNAGGSSGLTNLVNGGSQSSVRGVDTASGYTMGRGAFAEGGGTTASGNYSHAEGGGTTASGTYSHTEGAGTTASGTNSHAEGGATTASGTNSHTEGGGTTASGYYSHAEGSQTVANHASQHVFGEYNVADTSTATASDRGTYVEIVGNGTGDSARSNARTLDWDGNEVLAGKLTVGAAPTADMDVATKKYVDDNAGGLPEITAADDGKVMVAKNGEWVSEGLLTVGTEHVILPETEGVSLQKQYNLDLTAFPSVSLTDLQYSAVHNGRRYELGTMSSPEGYFAVYPPDFDFAQLSAGNMPEIAILLMQGGGASVCMVAILPEDTSHTLTLMAKPKTIVKNEYIPFAIKAGSGMGSIAEGEGTTASNAYSHAEGMQTTASGMVSHAEGFVTTASGDSSHAEGSNTTASGNNSHAEGSGTTASGSRSHAEGNSTTASGDNSHAEGHGGTYTINNVTYESGAKGKADHTEGYQTLTVAVTGDGNQGNHAEGYRTKATGGVAHSEGKETTASGPVSHAEGQATTASGSVSHAEGGNTVASGDYSHAEGTGTTASRDRSHAEGASTTAGGSASHAEGSNTTASGGCSHAEGSGTTARGNRSHAEGQNTTASGDSSHAEGASATASGDYSHTEGYGGTYTINNVTYESGAKGKADHTEGYQTLTAAVTDDGNQGNHAEGYRTKATGGAAHAEGSGTTASGGQSHAEGKNTIASGAHSHAEGLQTNASGSQSHAEGAGTTASGDKSHAEGVGTTASGIQSHAEGYHTTANHKAQHVFGEYNVADPSTAAATARGTYIEIVGNGTSDGARSNARTLDWNGNEVLAGKLTVGAAPTADMDVATKKYVDDNAGGLPEITAADDGKVMVAKNGEWVNVELFDEIGEKYVLMDGRSVTTNDESPISDVDISAIPRDVNEEDIEFSAIINGTEYVLTGRYEEEIWYLTWEKYFPEEDMSEEIQMQLTNNGLYIYYLPSSESGYTMTLIARTKTSISDKCMPFAIKTGSGFSSIAEGYETTASGGQSHAEGKNTTASGDYSHAEGQATIASGMYSHAEGHETTASGVWSHAESSGTTASGDKSHAEGEGTTASGNRSHAEGWNTTSSGDSSHAEGGGTIASGVSSHAEGGNTIANHGFQHVFGEFNVADPSTAEADSRGTYVEIVGNGTDFNAKSNARTLDWDGNEVLAGGLTVGAAGITIGRTTITEAQLTALLALLNS